MVKKKKINSYKFVIHSNFLCKLLFVSSQKEKKLNGLLYYNDDNIRVLIAIFPFSRRFVRILLLLRYFLSVRHEIHCARKFKWKIYWNWFKKKPHISNCIRDLLYSRVCVKWIYFRGKKKWKTRKILHISKAILYAYIEKNICTRYTNDIKEKQ